MEDYFVSPEEVDNPKLFQWILGKYAARRRGGRRDQRKTRSRPTPPVGNQTTSGNGHVHTLRFCGAFQMPRLFSLYVTAQMSRVGGSSAKSRNQSWVLRRKATQNPYLSVAPFHTHPISNIKWRLPYLLAGL